MDHSTLNYSNKNPFSKIKWWTAISSAVLIIVIIFLPFVFSSEKTEEELTVKVIKNDGHTGEFTVKMPDKNKTGEPQDVLFVTTGNTVEISYDGKNIHRFGQDREKKGGMLSTDFIDLNIKNQMYGRKLNIKLKTVDSTAAMGINKPVVVASRDARSYYTIKGIAGTVTAFALIVIAFFGIQGTIMLRNIIPAAKLALWYMLGILCLAVLILASEGRFLLFSDNAHGWMMVKYIVKFLIPLIILLYVREFEKPRSQKKLLMVAIIVNTAFVLTGVIFGIPDIIPVCDIDNYYIIILLFDVCIGISWLYNNIKHRVITRERLIEMILLIGSMLPAMAVTMAMKQMAVPNTVIHAVDIKTICAAVIALWMFYWLVMRTLKRMSHRE